MAGDILDTMQAVRRRTFDLVGHLSAAELERQVDPIMSPLVWDLAHIAAYEDLWLVHRFAGRPLLHPELAARYDAFETPRRASQQIELLDTAGAKEYLAEVRARRLESQGVPRGQPGARDRDDERPSPGPGAARDGPAPRPSSHRRCGAG